ncbi:MAG: YjbQ family protein [Candidatus Latescibacteria bacterium]|nr:YjbQ family protein [Candidatus Latescibacterota bacterium]NIO56738.1 YjbQ family protein [Candidatus Latescibacterota bacterium]NIT02323.1 YjbQ family protein [Candidatus Latescibacterota bacterium]NIT39206.1 YjbQ family protein [Candidatus Latescibacterota bacterium]
MKTQTSSLRVSTSKRICITNVTHLIDETLAQTSVGTGICLASVPHTTCGLTVNEYESGLVNDIERLASEMLGPLAKAGGFQHDRVDNNAQAHLTSGLLGRSLSLPVQNGRLHLGTWQSVFIVECDGPRTRTLDLLIMGE